MPRCALVASPLVEKAGEDQNQPDGRLHLAPIIHEAAVWGVESAVGGVLIDPWL